MSAMDGENKSNETPHSVTLKHDFYIGKMEVTREQWDAVMSINPSRGRGPYMPVENVSWDEAVAFCRELDKRFAKELPDGYRFDLPTEAQREYAARGGNKSHGYKYSGSNDVSDVAWYNNNAGGNHSVGTKQSNELGLYDMSGNVWEWCRDQYDPEYSDDPEFLTGNNPVNSGTNTERRHSDFGVGENYMVSRSGSWASGALECRVSTRSRLLSSSHYDDLGFRLAIVLDK